MTLVSVDEGSNKSAVFAKFAFLLHGLQVTEAESKK
jgi:hypothetical protein